MEGISKSGRKENQTNLIKKEKNQNANIGMAVNPTLDDKKTKENQNQKNYLEHILDLKKPLVNKKIKKMKKLQIRKIMIIIFIVLKKLMLWL